MTTSTDSAEHAASAASDGAAPAPIGLIAPEWALRSSNRGAALWRHAGVMAASAGERVEVLCLDRQGLGRPFEFRDEWNVPAPGARFRVRRVRIGGPMAELGALERARLEGIALEWVRERQPRLAHVLDLEAFGPGLLMALAAIEMPTILTLERVDELQGALARGGESGADGASALADVRRVIVRRASDIDAAEACGAPRERIRVMAAGGARGETAVLRAYASLYRLIGGSVPGASSGDMTTSSGVPSGGSAA